jgi:acetyltransferase-like isoleucine patch superfamily enzyme
VEASDSGSPTWPVRAAELPPRVRWLVWRLICRAVLSRAFRSWGLGSVLVAPRRLRGVERMTVGRGCAIHEGAWLQCEDADSLLTIGDRVYIGHDVHIHSLGHVAISDDCMLADGVMIHNGRHWFDGRWQAADTGDIELGERVWVGGGAAILGGVRVGADAVIGANAVVTRDVAPGATVAGAPARPLEAPVSE